MGEPAWLVLADGSIYQGCSIGARGRTVGELVFNTSLSGYQEILSDPSYAKQIVTLTCSHIGNTGCNLEDMESSRIWASGLIIRNYAYTPSNYRKELSLSQFLKKHQVVGIADIDTRALTLKLRECGSINGCIFTDYDDLNKAKETLKGFGGLAGLDLAKVVTRQTIERWHEGLGSWANASQPQSLHVVVYDYGVKHTILRLLHDLGCHVTVVPAYTSFEELMALNPQGVLLSNGPGDPSACTYAILLAKQLLEAQIPVFGICLGFQILGIACGAKSIKMKFGHHGSNHPVVEVGGKKRVFITSQNHNFSIDEATLPDCLEVTHRSLFDQSLQGFKHKSGKAFGFQGHPEASPGPHDSFELFQTFVAMM